MCESLPIYTGDMSNRGDTTHFVKESLVNPWAPPWTLGFQSKQANLMMFSFFKLQSETTQMSLKWYMKS
jgi:hypothetical protein